MAGFVFREDFQSALAELSEMSAEEKYSIIEPAADIAKTGYKEAISSTFIRRTGALEDSVTVKAMAKDGQPYARIYLLGKHPGSSTGIRMKKTKNGKRRRSGRYSGTNAEVGYFLNYGTPRIKATHWFDKASEKLEPQVQDKLEEGWNAYLDSKGV